MPNMDFITENTKKLYRNYLLPSLGGALAMSIYSIVDTVAVGQYAGVDGATATAIINPVFNILVFIGIVTGIGGSVMMSYARGEGNKEKGDSYFTTSLILFVIISIISWIIFNIYHIPLLKFFGANDDMIPTIMQYSSWIVGSCPIFSIPVFVSAFLRNDGNPNLAMIAVIVGGVFNCFGDWYLVFPCDMGLAGAAIATVIGTCIQCIIMCSHFFSKKCTLRIVRPYHITTALRKLIIVGVGAGILDLGTVFISIIMNNQIMRYGGANELAIYGTIAVIAALVQALFAGIGQALQPLVSTNFGIGRKDRVIEFWHHGLRSVLIIGIVVCALMELFPVEIIKLFIDATPEVIAVAPISVRIYSILFLFMGVNIVSVYYLQSVIQNKYGMTISILRSFVVIGILIIMLPIVCGINGVWASIPATEMIVSILAWYFVRRYNCK